MPTFKPAVLALEDGSVFRGRAFGADATVSGECVFNTSMTGYQEIITDPSYAGQIITFTFPHVGNVGTNVEDIESVNPVARGVVLRGDITEPANWRASRTLDDWLRNRNLPGICGIDTRAVTRRVRDGGAPNGVVAHHPDGKFDIPELVKMANDWPGLEGMDLAIEVTTKQSYGWDETTWTLGKGYGRLDKPRYHVVAVDYGAKRNILRCLANTGCKVTVVPAATTAARSACRAWRARRSPGAWRGPAPPRSRCAGWPRAPRGSGWCPPAGTRRCLQPANYQAVRCPCQNESPRVR